MVDIAINKKQKNDGAKGFSLKNPISVVLILLMLIGLGAAIFFWNDARSARSESPEGVAARNEEESARVIGSLNKILLTESDGNPTVARVEDADVLRTANEDFYKNANTGDYLILYPQRAVLYREEESKVINVAPIINTDQLRASTADNANESTQPAPADNEPQQ